MAHLCFSLARRPSYIEGRLRLAESARQRGRSTLNKNALLDSAADLTASVRAAHGKEQGTSPASEVADAVVSDDSSAATGTPRQRGPASLVSNGGSPVGAARKPAADITGVRCGVTSL